MNQDGVAGTLVTTWWPHTWQCTCNWLEIEFFIVQKEGVSELWEQHGGHTHGRAGAIG